ncbi:MAG: ornithine carbamoyltransferase [Candidatus Micrarchaeia archaeon]
MNLLGMGDLSKKQIFEILDIAERMKKEEDFGKPLSGKTLAMLFEKPSTRTRVSFEVAMAQLGGHAIYLDFVGTQISRGETMADTARVLSRYVDAITARLYKHADLEEIAQNSTIPVINALTELEHPCQIIGDLLTIREKKGEFEGKKIVFVGDVACNVANSLMIGAATVGMDVTLVGPIGAFPPNKKIVQLAKRRGKVEITDQLEGVKDADIVYTDVWVSMGFEAERAERLKAFVPYQVNKSLMKRAKKNAIVMHCLPAHRGLEITSDVLDSKQSVVIDQAENRLHTEKALLLYLLCKK